MSTVLCQISSAQVPERPINVQQGILNEQLIDTDSSSIQEPSVVADTTNLAEVDSLEQEQPKGDIETTIKYSAKDSINFNVNSKIVKLYGDAHITYGSIELESERINIDYANNTLSAESGVDSTGQKYGFPIFKNGNEVYETKSMTYNFKTGRARISEVVTKQGEGFLHGETVYKNAQDELFSINNSYTTCNLADPHFRIRARRTKAIPDDKIVSGPANLEINDVPTPLWIPFGMFPAKTEASSGVIIPSYGEESRRGFFLRGGGYFFDINEYIKATLTGDLYSKGGHGINMNSIYRKRYAYNGNFNFSYTQIRLSDQVEDESKKSDFRLAWSHSPQSKGNSRFSASVNAATSTYNSNNFIGINSDRTDNRFDNTTRQMSSNINYNKTFGSSPFSLGLSARHNQDVQTKEVRLLLPSVAFNMGNVYPLADANTGMDVLEKLNVRYTMAGTNEITNNLGRIGVDADQDSIAPFDLETLPTFLNNARRGIRHTIPLSTSFKALKHFTASPQFSYEEIWYFESLVYELDSTNSAVVVDTADGFNRLYEYSMGTSFATRLYGTYFFKKGKVEAIRHVMNPNISFNYAPDFSDPRYGFYQRFVTEEGEEILADRYSRFVYGGASSGERASIGFSLNNTLEMKVKSKKDTTGAGSVKVPLLNNFGVSSSYNVLAEEFRLSNISFRANTSLFKNKFTVNVNGVLDPYVYILDSIGVNNRDVRTVYQRRIDRLAWKSGQGLGQITSATIALGTNLNPKAREAESSTEEKIRNSQLSEMEKEWLINNPGAYVDFNIPWSLRVNYILNFSKSGFEESTTTQTLNFSGDLSLTEKWKINFTSGFDFENEDFTTTRLGITRDLHCWQMDVNWTPFGRFQSYSFSIHVKSSMLQDLKIDRNRSIFDQ